MDTEFFLYHRVFGPSLDFLSGQSKNSVPNLRTEILLYIIFSTFRYFLTIHPQCKVQKSISVPAILFIACKTGRKYFSKDGWLIFLSRNEGGKLNSTKEVTPKIKNLQEGKQILTIIIGWLAKIRKQRLEGLTREEFLQNSTNNGVTLEENLQCSTNKGVIPNLIEEK